MVTASPRLRPFWSVTRPASGLQRDDIDRLGLEIKRRPVLTAVARDVWLEVPLVKGWLAAYRFTVDARGRARVAEVRVFPSESAFRSRPPGEWSAEWLGVRASVPSGGLTSAVLKKVRTKIPLRHLGEILTFMRERLGEAFVKRGWPALMGFPMPAVKAASSRGRRGRKPLPDEFLAQIASEYATDKSASPIQQLAARHGVPVARARSWVYTARERDFLLGREWGKPVGVLSPKAEFFLKKPARRPKRRSV